MHSLIVTTQNTALVWYPDFASDAIHVHDITDGVISPVAKETLTFPGENATPAKILGYMMLLASQPV